MLFVPLSFANYYRGIYLTNRFDKALPRYNKTLHKSIMTAAKTALFFRLIKSNMNILPT